MKRLYITTLIVALTGGLFAQEAANKKVQAGLAGHNQCRAGCRKEFGLFWELNPGPLAPEARIMPLDQTAR